MRINSWSTAMSNFTPNASSRPEGTPVKCRALIAGASALAVALAMAPAAAVGGPAPFGPAFAGSFGTSNWTGYVDVAHANVKLRYVETHFTIPLVSCTSPFSKASFWAGLDGLTNGTVEQVGISTNCNMGNPVYLSWWEMFPEGVHYRFSVRPGDSITAEVFYDESTGIYHLTLNDNTKGLSINQQARCPSGSTCKNTNAEVVLEADGGTKLSRFPTVTFANSKVTSRNGTHGTFQNTSLWDLNQTLMTGSHGPLATLSTPSNNGANFSVTYQRSS
jgi:hypothetical protein